MEDESCKFKIKDIPKDIELGFDEEENIKIDNYQYEISISKHSKTHCTIKFERIGD